MEKLCYGVAYYDEYMPYERLEKDVEMMKRAGINVVRVFESTWSTSEPRDGEFDFTHLDRVLRAMGEAGIGVIVGTPTYAVPSWMVKKHPDIMVTTAEGRQKYGARQKMDIINEHYLFYCERAIRTLMQHVKDHPAVIGYQLDNETKHYGVAGERVQRRFVQYLKEKFGTVQALNAAFGLDYWSNALSDWEDFPDVTGTINASLGCEFEKFRRTLVTGFLSWQARLVREYKRKDQFITHNFDFGWKEGSYGVQPDVDHPACAQFLDVVGCDIYHPSQDALTGAELSFCGDLARCLKGGNYYVLETQAQGFPQWTPYDGQLRLLAFAHLACGADMVEYWHWHSIHNSAETYWKGLLSHDFSENKTYREAVTVGRSFRQLQSKLLHLKKENKIALLVSNLSLTALEWFPMPGVTYNDVVRRFYDALYEHNFECDVVFPSADLSRYKVVLAPALYCAGEELIEKLRAFTQGGGTLISTFKSFFSDENVKVYADAQPHGMTDVFGMTYDQFTVAKDVSLSDGQGICARAEGFMECLRPQGGAPVLMYAHDNWRQYAAATVNFFGKGKAYYFGCLFEKEVLAELLQAILREDGVYPAAEEKFPVIVRSGINQFGKTLLYVFNYSSSARTVNLQAGKYAELLTGRECTGTLGLEKWGVAIFEKK